MSLKLTEVKVFASKNPVVNIGFGTATFNEGLQVKFNIRKSKAGVEFVSWPQSSYVKGDGTTEYVNEVVLLKGVSDAINNQIITEFNKVLAIGSGTADKGKGPDIPAVDNSATTTAATASTKKSGKPKINTNW